MHLRHLITILSFALPAMASLAQTNLPLVVTTNAPAAPQQYVLTFEDALKLAVRNDPAIAMARGDERISRLDYDQSTRALTPSATFEGSYAMNEGGDPGDPFTSKFNPDEQWRGIFKITQSLFDARVKPAERRELSQWRASAGDYTNMVRTRLLIVGIAYYRAIQAQTVLSVADQAKQLADMEVHRAALRVQAGEARQTDLLRAQVDQSRSERALNEARNDVVLAARELFRLCGIPQEATVNVQPPAALPEPATEVLGELVAIGRNLRADISAASNRIVAAQEQVSVTSRDFYPKFELQLNETLASPEIYQKGHDTWDILVTAKFTLYDKGSRRTQRLQDLVRVEQAKQDLLRIEKQAASETDRALATLAVARLNFETAKREESLADQNYSILSEQAKNGLATALDVSTALVDLNRARLDKVRLQYEVEIAKLALLAATGQLAYSE